MLHCQALTPEDRAILIFDLGGGTFDTTVIRLRGSDINVICTDGNHRLGGASWDSKLQDYLLDEFVAEHPDQPDPRADEEFLQGLAMDVERLKRELTGVRTRTYTMRFGDSVSQIEVTRDLFETLTSELLEETLAITQRTIAVAGARYVDQFDDVLLVGGASKMPAVTRLLKERFGFEAQLHDPDLAVAKGAALLAIIESVKFSLQYESASSPPGVEQVAEAFGLTTEQVRDLARKRITTVVPRAFGTRVLDSSDPTLQRTYVDHVLHANDPLPIEVGPNRYTTAYDNQTGVEIGIYEQSGAVESEELEHNTRIGGSVIYGLPSLPRDSPIDVTYAMD